MPEEYVIITAGGSGSRMGTYIPKQFLELNRLPVVMHSIKSFVNYSEDISVVLVLPEDAVDSWQVLCEKHNFNYSHKVCPGGDTRFQSVKNGLERVPDDAWVAVQDAARPLSSTNLIQRCFAEARQMGNAVPSIPVSDSMREVVGEDNHPVDRSMYQLIQTPQVYKANTLKKAYDQAFKSSFTDEATVVESIGIKIHLIEGETSNIKITRQEDLLIAKTLLGF